VNSKTLVDKATVSGSRGGGWEEKVRAEVKRDQPRPLPRATASTPRTVYSNKFQAVIRVSRTSRSMGWGRLPLGSLLFLGPFLHTYTVPFPAGLTPSLFHLENRNRKTKEKVKFKTLPDKATVSESRGGGGEERLHTEVKRVGALQLEGSL
jgi:hypothetical protein